MVITSKGIYLYDSSLIIKRNIVIIFDSNQFESREDAYHANIAQFLDEDDGYIICLINNKTYFLLEEGILISNYDLNYIEKRGFYQIIPYTHQNNSYYYTIISIDNYNFTFRNYIYDSLTLNISLDNIIIYSTNYLSEKMFTCQLMKNNSNKYITCFHGNLEEKYCSVFNPGNFSLVPNLGGIINDFGGQYYVSSIKTLGRNKTAFCSLLNKEIICYGYNINTNNFTKPIFVTNNESTIYPLDINVEYIAERDEFVFICMGYNYEFYMKMLSTRGEIEVLNSPFYLINNDHCKDLGRFNLFFSSNLGKYGIFTDNDCQNIFYLDLIITNYTNGESLLIIPNGFFINDTIHYTLDKCHDNCETCSKGPEYDKNNCVTCKSNLIFNNGNCFMEICPIKCKNCSFESNQNDSCISCNNDEGYYPKIDELLYSDFFVKCYKDPDNYYLKDGIYYPCFSSCKKCFNNGNETNNNCTECISNYEFKNDSFYYANCYQKCQYYYYYDSSNRYNCTNNYICPERYNKLIREKKKCIDNCSNDDIYFYEFQNICYSNITILEIPETTIINNIETNLFTTEATFVDIIEDIEERVPIINSTNTTSNTNITILQIKIII